MSEASVSGAPGTEQPQKEKPRQKRTRTGCERCRAQRRKCGEEKPQCKRCVGAGAECKYAASHISFLEKNTRTLSPNAVSRTQSTSTSDYSVLEFVNNNPQGQHVESPSAMAETHGQQGPQHHDRHISTFPPENETQKDRTHARSPAESRPRAQQDYNELMFGSSHGRDSSELDNVWPLAGQSSLSDDEVGLLQHYCHHIAPWLDVFDQDHTFGHRITQIAMNSPCVLEALLKLSAVFSGRPANMVTRRNDGAVYLQSMSTPPSSRSAISALRMMSDFVLGRTLLFVQDVPSSWESSLHGDKVAFGFNEYQFVDAGQRQIWFNILALVARLEVSYSLMNETAPVMAIGLIDRVRNSLAAEKTTTTKSQEILKTSLHCLGLLAETMNLCLPVSESADEAAREAYAASALTKAARTARWEELLIELQSWQRNRPSELQELLAVESRDTTFPTVVFPSGAGVVANNLFHTGMFLLLNNRPQSSSLSDIQRALALDAAQMSPLWHARRACGIARSSDPEHTKCWDPVMIAAFSLVARRMTHPLQLNDLRLCLDRVKVAGWQLDGLIGRLRDDWGYWGPMAH